VRLHRTLGISSVVVLQLCTSTAIAAQTVDAPISLQVGAGRPLEIVIADRVTVHSVGQPVTGTLVNPVYAYDRIVVPAGTTVLGHIVALQQQSKFARTRAMMAGDFAPKRQVVLQFDTLVLGDDRMAISTMVKTEIPNLKRTEAPKAAEDAEPRTGIAGRLEHEAASRARESIEATKQKAHDVLAEIKDPGKKERLTHELVQRLPYHPQFIEPGMGYQAELLAPIDFGTAVPTGIAEPSARPAPSSILRARLVTALDSSKTPRGTTVEAVVTEPVFSDSHELIYPEGTILAGEVTTANPARSMHRNGQLRFLFESVRPPAASAPEPLLASLHAVHASDDDKLAIDEEGGAKPTNSKTRFIAPTLAILALRANLDDHEHLDPDGDGHMIHSGSPGAQSVGGAIGFGLAGIPLSLAWRPLGVALSAVGAARTTYSNIFSKGREMAFPADTVMELQLAPGPSRPQ